ncbi:MAG: DNA gyrase subunit A [Candidatus Micrarchaeota archaeon]
MAKEEKGKGAKKGEEAKKQPKASEEPKEKPASVAKAPEPKKLPTPQAAQPPAQPAEAQAPPAVQAPSTPQAKEQKEARPIQTTTNGIRPRYIEDEMKDSYLDYAMSVIVGRALPDVRDGLKPVHRRVLYAMSELGNTSDKAYKKSARVVGEVLGKYHPHGDTAVYDTLVRMAQNFSLRYPLIDGQGNFGSIDGDNAAAMRYTEVRMDKIAEEMLADIEKKTVDFVPNFDGSLQEPSVLPARIPNLLINGSSGIAVGMATNVPPHNLSEIVDGLIMEIDNPNTPLIELMKAVKGPDFPTGGYICGMKGILDAYSTGRGIVKMRAKVASEKSAKGRERIIVNELPYQVNKAELVKLIAELVKEKKVEGISDLRDESDRDGMRIVIELKKDFTPDVVLNQLYKHTPLETTFGVINLALVNKEPEVLTLKEILDEFVKYRKEIVTRRCKCDLEIAEDRAHIVAGLMIAQNDIDEVVKTVRKAQTPVIAKELLMKLLKLSEKQALAILDMKLQKLTGLEREKLEEERKELEKTIEGLNEILGSEPKLFEVIKKELLEVKEKYGDERRTQFIEDVGDLDTEDLIKEETVVVTVSRGGYVKRTPLGVYREQRRGGRGVIGTDIKEEDFIKDVLVCSTHDYLLCFTDKGRIHWLKVYRIPVADRYALGKAIVNLLELQQDEKLAALIPLSEFKETEYLIMATEQGVIKRSKLLDYSHPRRGGIIAITLRENDRLIEVKRTSGKQDVIFASKNGMGIRFHEDGVRSIGRTAQGVRGIRLRKGDAVVAMAVAEFGETILTITENGYGKRTMLEDYRVQGRGGMGVINIKTSERNGKVVCVRSVRDDDGIIVINSAGVIIRVPVIGISVIGRNTQGVRIMKLEEKQKVVAVARVAKEDMESEGEVPAEGAEEAGKTGAETETQPKN